MRERENEPKKEIKRVKNGGRKTKADYIVRQVDRKAERDTAN